MPALRHARISHRASAIALGLIATFALTAPALAKPGNEGGNSDAAAACDGAGYLDWTDAAGAPFRNEGACASYAARGGTLVPVPVAVNPFSVRYSEAGDDGFQATVTGTGLEPNTTVDFFLTWGEASGMPIGFISDPSGNVTFTTNGACTSAGSPLTAVGVSGTPAGGEHTEYSLPLPDTVCAPAG